MNSLGEDGLEGAKARAGNDLSRIVSSELLGPSPGHCIFVEIVTG